MMKRIYTLRDVSKLTLILLNVYSSIYLHKQSKADCYIFSKVTTCHNMTTILWMLALQGLNWMSGDVNII
jgi:hypothetical protein